MLHCIEQTHDHDLATEVAAQMLHHFRCEGQFPQRPGPQTTAGQTHPVIQKTIAYLEERIEDSILIPDICKQLGIPQRQLERLFNKHVGCSVVQFCRLMKLQYARTLLVSTNMTIREILSGHRVQFHVLFFILFHPNLWPQAQPVLPGVAR